MSRSVGPTVAANVGCAALEEVIAEAESLLQHGSEVPWADYEPWRASALQTLIAALGNDNLLVARAADAAAQPPPQGGGVVVGHGTPYRRSVETTVGFMREAVKMLGRGLVVQQQRAAPTRIAARDLTLNVGAPTGVVNLGEIFGDIRAEVSALADRGDATMAEGIRTLLDAIVEHPSLSEESKKDAGDLLGAVVEQAQVPAHQQKGILVKLALGHLSTICGTASDLASLWSKYGPQIATYFGL